MGSLFSVELPSSRRAVRWLASGTAPKLMWAEDKLDRGDELHWPKPPEKTQGKFIRVVNCWLNGKLWSYKMWKRGNVYWPCEIVETKLRHSRNFVTSWTFISFQNGRCCGNLEQTVLPFHLQSTISVLLYCYKLNALPRKLENGDRFEKTQRAAKNTHLWAALSRLYFRSRFHNWASPNMTFP